MDHLHLIVLPLKQHIFYLLSNLFVIMLLIRHTISPWLLRGGALGLVSYTTFTTCMRCELAKYVYLVMLVLKVHLNYLICCIQMFGYC